MSIEHHERLLDIEDHVEYLLSQIELVDPDQIYILDDIVQDILWLTEKVRHHDSEIIQYQEEIEMLLSKAT
jgi:hypothetical protein